jgi:hypothetical protein
VVKDVELETNALKEAFAKTETPLGYYFAGELSAGGGRERFDFFKKSAEGGCSWGQVEYGEYFKRGESVEQDAKVYVEWLEKAANQNNPSALRYLGNWFGSERLGNDKEKAVSYYHASAELGWKASMSKLAQMLRYGEGCEQEFIQAVIWGVKAGSGWFWNMLPAVRVKSQNEMTNNLDCDFSQLCYTLGWGLYWYQYDTERWGMESDDDQAFGNRCLDYYCSCVELQQKSIFTFLLYWNQTAAVKDVGVLIAQMIWEERSKNLLKEFDEENEEQHQEPEMKRIKK